MMLILEVCFALAGILSGEKTFFAIALVLSLVYLIKEDLR